MQKRFVCELSEHLPTCNLRESSFIFPIKGHMWINILSHYNSIPTKSQNTDYQQQSGNQLTTSIYYTTKWIELQAIHTYWALSVSQEVYQEEISKRRQGWVCPHRSHSKATAPRRPLTLLLCRTARAESENVWSAYRGNCTKLLTAEKVGPGALAARTTLSVYAPSTTY